MGEREFIALMAALTASTALGVDVMLPALGEIRDTFGLPGDSTTLSWTVSLYLLGLGCAQLVFGPLADRFGRKPTLYAGLALYVAGAAGSALAPSLGFLLASRVVWGFGAASPRVMALTITRDRYVGDRMARVMSLIIAVFLIAPILGPAIGELLLLSGTWRWVFGFSVVTAVGLAVWLVRLDETLDPAHQLPLDLKRLSKAFGTIVGTRVTLGYGLALTFELSAFTAFLASFELLLDDVYDRSGQFALLFGASAAVMAMAALGSARTIAAVGSEKVLRTAILAHAIGGSALVAISLTGGGAPSFWLWYAVLTGLNALHVVIAPICNSLAMTPMGEIAGTASAVIGAVSLVVASLLSSITNNLISGSVTPLSLGYLCYGLLAGACILWAAGRPRRSTGPVSVRA
ncbi:MAG: MFS transporter [Acidimicrobiia bacterium]|nr:MFS transporter [Acidimicrobiia bacterium]